MSTDDVPIKPEDFLPESRNISNSEVTTFNSCLRMYNFNFIDNITPLEDEDPLARGSLGHEAFERYITARLNGASHEKALIHGKSAFIDFIKANPQRIELAMYTQQLWERYMTVHEGWPEWELLGTEERLDLTLTDTINIAIRYDILVRERATGRTLIGDWKYTYDFWSYEDHALNGQLPKYIAVLRLNNRHVDGGFIEEIRTRKLTSPEKLRDHRNLWKRTYYWPSHAKLKTTMQQHIETSLKIEEHRNTPTEHRLDTPVLNKYGPCKYCSYKSLCISKMEGMKDLSVEIRTNYKENTYGYNKGQSVPGSLNTVDDIKELL